MILGIISAVYILGTAGLLLYAHKKEKENKGFRSTTCSSETDELCKVHH